MAANVEAAMAAAIAGFKSSMTAKLAPIKAKISSVTTVTTTLGATTTNTTMPGVTTTNTTKEDTTMDA